MFLLDLAERNFFIENDYSVMSCCHVVEVALTFPLKISITKSGSPDRGLIHYNKAVEYRGGIHYILMIEVGIEVHVVHDTHCVPAGYIVLYVIICHAYMRICMTESTF